MTLSKQYPADAYVVGSGPNGLAAALRLALEGKHVVVFERSKTPGGGTRTLELMQEGIWHDVCSAIHPTALSSPFLRGLELEKEGLEWIHPEIPVAHPLDGRPAVMLHRDLERTAAGLGRDGGRYKRLLGPLVEHWEALCKDIFGPLRFPEHPLLMAQFGLNALQSAWLLSRRFQTEEARALFAGLAAHSILPLSKPTTAAIGLVLAAAGHAVGWPFPKGGSKAITAAMVSRLERLGGQVVCSTDVESIQQFERGDVVLFDLTPRQLAKILGERCPDDYRRKLNGFRYGSGSFKIDYILSEPVPWSDPECRKAGTLHLGGTYAEVAASEKKMSIGGHSKSPYALVAQHSLFDRTRVGEGPDGTGGKTKETLWVYCHIPNGSEIDMTDVIEAQIERFAPGFRDCIEQRHVLPPAALEAYNPNYIGGDINGGRQDLSQLFRRPVSIRDPYATPVDGVYICSSSTPPGGGVHGMCGFHAAELALRREFH